MPSPTTPPLTAVGDAEPVSNSPSADSNYNNQQNQKQQERNSDKLSWTAAAHSRSDSHSSSQQDDGARFEVPPTTEGPRYQIPQLQSVSSQRKYLVVMVGLPARGKTFIAQKLARMLAWLGLGAVVHNVQVAYKSSLHPPRRLELADFDFTDKSSAVFGTYMKALDKIGDQVKDFFVNRNGLVAFVNDDLVNKDVREEVEKRVGCHADQTIFIEVTRDAELNIQNDLEKIMNPKEFGVVNGATDGQAVSDARKKFYQRVEILKQQYTSVKETAKSWITLHNGSHLEACNVRGYLPSRITSVLLNLGSQKKRYPIYFSRHGESTYNLEDRIGGNPPLTDKGKRDAEYLRDFVGIIVDDIKKRKEVDPSEPDLQVWSSQLLRTQQTSQPAVDTYNLERLAWQNLNEIHAGVCEDLTYGEVREKYPSIDYFRSQAKYSFRYPQGESYQDIVQRLEPIILELENAEREIVVVAHQAVLRALLAYFGHKSAESSVYATVPHRTIWRCSYNSDGVSFLEELQLPLKEGQGLPPPVAPQTNSLLPGSSKLLDVGSGMMNNNTSGSDGSNNNNSNSNQQQQQSTSPGLSPYHSGMSLS